MQYVYDRDTLQIVDRIPDTKIMDFLPTEAYDVVSYPEDLPLSFIHELAPLLKEAVKREALAYVDARYTTEEKIRETIWLIEGNEEQKRMCRAVLEWCDALWMHYAILRERIYAGDVTVRWDYTEEIPYDFYTIKLAGMPPE
jgi:hypothetical protein